MDKLAQQAVAGIKSGMVVGLGTGRAASRGVRALAERVQAEKLDLRCVSTSRATDELAVELGLRLVDLNSVQGVDILFDGADEVDPNLFMIKGGGGAMTRERIVAHAAAKRIYMIDSSKLTPRLGTRFKVPIEVLPLAKALVQRELEDHMDFEGVWRQRAMSGTGSSIDYLTDNGNLIFDLTLAAEIAADKDDLFALDSDLKQLPGVLDHGLFLMECETLLVEWPDGGGRLETRKRRDEA
ncbi:MAG: ribose-5-phosphate isomerase RpiA [Phycisphaerales bacterium]